MSIKNRNVVPGTYSIKEENKGTLLFAKIACFFVGHKETKIIAKGMENKKYCLCCWKKL